MKEYIENNIENTKILLIASLDEDSKKYYLGKLYAYQDVLKKLKAGI